MKNKKPMRSIKAITLRIFIFTFILWAAAMYGMTMVVAQMFYSAFLERQQRFVHDVGSVLEEIYADEDALADVKSKPAGIFALMYRTIWETRWVSYGIMSPENWDGSGIFGRLRTGILRNPSYAFQSAVLFADVDGNIIMDSSDFVHIHYIPQDIWITLRDAYEEENAALGRLVFNLDLVEGMAGSSLPMHMGGVGVRMLNIFAVRITGFVADFYIHPIKLCYISHEHYNQAFERAFESARNGGEFREHYEIGTNEFGVYETFRAPPTSALDNAGFLEWTSMFDASAEVLNAEALVTVYGLWPWLENVNVGGSPVTAGSNQYDSVLSFLREHADNPFALNSWMPLDAGDRSLRNIMVAHAHIFRDAFTEYDVESGAFSTKPDFIMLTAIHGNPLGHTINSLTLVYSVTFVIVFFGAVGLKQVIEKRLTQPLEMVNKGIADGWRQITFPEDKPQKWRELYELYEYYEQISDELPKSRNELARLRTALEYAKEAEQNRRQMTSNIAHELKTPLAIIHSYSEGLRERIAEEKREQYLDVIIAESERMDAMVMEMLDLSRLEAGKVVLARDEFSLSELAQSIFDKLELTAHARALNVSFDLKGECYINADEARISQVISNFAANAIIYTPRGGNIIVKTYVNRGTVFSVENDSKPFTDEELSKVWEIFYQADNARADKGAGLGLAITKKIIELHGGKCFVKNTESGVRFGFVI
ncbi:MAG: HAMP domain-containing histidine kinase [Oscillospiraceae bacterium]|nr:HAMP domain-containing histidine kinase [Oscillospiraceae bacterium]